MRGDHALFLPRRKTLTTREDNAGGKETRQNSQKRGITLGEGFLSTRLQRKKEKRLGGRNPHTKEKLFQNKSGVTKVVLFGEGFAKGWQVVWKKEKRWVGVVETIA